MRFDASDTLPAAPGRILGRSRFSFPRPAQNLPRRAVRALVLALAAALLLPPLAGPAPAGAMPPPPYEPPRPKQPKDKKPPATPDRPAKAPPNSERPAAPAADSSWVIVLAAFRGEGAQASAMRALSEARMSAGLADAQIEARGENVIVAYGRYPAPDDPAAADALQRIRGLTIGNARPYANSFLAPPFSVQLGSRPEYNLLTAKQRYGEDALYTLQIGAYGRDDLERPTEADLKEARRAAEEAATKLRHEGELAFYYHGPYRSMVTVGVFTIDDFDPQTPGYNSPRLLETRKRFPNNLYNGAGIRETRRGQKPQLQTSRLVNIPTR